MVRRCEPQPILLPELKPRRKVTSGQTILVRPLSTAEARFHCSVCDAIVLELGDRFCGYCGVRLRNR